MLPPEDKAWASTTLSALSYLFMDINVMHKDQAYSRLSILRDENADTQHT